MSLVKAFLSLKSHFSDAEQDKRAVKISFATRDIADKLITPPASFDWKIAEYDVKPICHLLPCVPLTAE